MSISYFHPHKNSSSKSIRESRNRFVCENCIQVSWQPAIDISGKRQWGLNDCKICLNDFTYLKRCKTEKTWFPLKHIGGIMGEETGSRYKFNSIPFYQLCLKITTYSINHHASPSFYIAHARRMSQFQTLIRSRASPLNTQTCICCVSWCHYFDTGVDKWLGGKCTLYEQDTKNSSVYNLCCILWR